MTIMEKTTGLFFNPNGMNLYANDPNSHTNVVLFWSYLEIGTLLYHKNSSVNE